jgi:hypothetical protein
MGIEDLNAVGSAPSSPPPSGGSTGKAEVPKEIKIVPLNGQGAYSAPIANFKDPSATIFTATVAGKENTMCAKIPDSDKYHCEGFEKPADMEEKGLLAVKLPNPGKFEVGTNFDKTVNGLVQDESLTRFDVPHEGNQHTEMKFYKGDAKVSDDGKSVAGGKLVATYDKNGDKITLIDANKHKFVPDAKGNISKN